jgi:hypothetical protein
MKKGCQKVDEFEKEHAYISSRLKDVIVHLEVLEFQVLRNVLWAEGFAKQLTLSPIGLVTLLLHVASKEPYIHAC